MSSRLLPLVVLLVTTACATTGATLGSGVGDAALSRSPWYAGARTTPAAAAGAVVGVLPVVYQRRAGQGAVFDPSGASDSPMAALLAEMNAFLDSIGAANGSALVGLSTDGSADPGLAMQGVPPDVRFGCRTEGNLPGEDCVARGDSVLGRDPDLNQMLLTVGRPSAEWTRWFAEATRRANVEHALVLTIEVGEYHVRQRGITGQKSVELGTGHVQDLPWLTSLEQPVQVIQLTGALVGRDGKAVRIGAEGILARRTRLAAAGLGLTELITDADVEAVRSRRREDLADRPIAWKVALRTMVRELTR